MNAFPTPRDVERFRDAVARRLGLSFEDAKLGFLGEALRRRLAADGRPCDQYLAALEDDSAAAELAALAQELTVGETYFLRNVDQFRAFGEAVLPDRMRVGEARKVLRFLSAGCSSGEEAYSIAIMVRETISDPSWDISIRAVDVNPAALKKGATGRFSNWALRETSPERQRRWFRPEGRDLVLDEGARAAVTFEERNLAADDAALWQPSNYDAIFCRNVLMYFTPEKASALVGRIASALAPGGYLFLGHAETLRGLSHAFHLRNTHGTFYYQRKDANEDEISAPPSFERFVPAAPLLERGIAVAHDTDWADAIGKAAGRIEVLSRSQGIAASPLAAATPEWSLGHALDLLQRERFTQALDLVDRLPREATDDPEVLLLRAVLLAHSGELAGAGEVASRLLEIDELNAGANYVLALCCEGTGDPAAAVEHDRVAVYLDPAFAMPRLHLGLLARRAGDLDTARRELGQALVLLQREDASRLLLFGGGFNRGAMIALCAAELQACEGRP